MRSKIVHSGVRPEYIKNLDSYLEYAKALSSRMIIEMILHNITIDVLDEKLTELGFGDHTKISQNYKPIIANLKMYSKLFDNLPPLKKTK
ncbi:MAG: hypothetical protein H0V65_00455 [Chitinophagales bacterium]|nr:hypothetical protein [Chitinophagales bacterium]